MVIYLTPEQAMESGLPVGTPIEVEVEVEFEGKVVEEPMVAYGDDVY